MNIAEITPGTFVDVQTPDGPRIRSQYLFRDTRVAVFENLATGGWYELALEDEDGAQPFKLALAERRKSA